MLKRILVLPIFAVSLAAPASAQSLAGALFGFGRVPSLHDTETCAAQLNYLAALDADPNVIAIPLPDRGVVTVTRKDIEALVLMMQLAYLADPKGSDKAIDEMIDGSQLGVVEGAALSTLAKSTLSGDSTAKDAAITLMIQQAKQKVRAMRDDVRAHTGEPGDPCSGLVPGASQP